MSSAVSRPLSSDKKFAKPAAARIVPISTWVPMTLFPRAALMPSTDNATPAAATTTATAMLKTNAMTASAGVSVLLTRIT